MKNWPQYQERTFVIPAGGAVEWNRYGDAFGCLDATGDFFVKFDSQPRTQFRKGLTFEAPEKFNQVRLENRSENELRVEVFAAQGQLRDARLTLPADLEAFTGAARVITSSKVEVGSGERIQIAPSNADRVELLVTNMGSSPVFLGDDSVVWGQGLPLAAGSTATLNIQTEIYAYAQAAGIQTLAILETEK